MENTGYTPPMEQTYLFQKIASQLRDSLGIDNEEVVINFQVERALRVANDLNIKATEKGILQVMEAGYDPLKVIVELANLKAYESRAKLSEKEIESIAEKFPTVEFGKKPKKVGMPNWKERVKSLTKTK